MLRRSATTLMVLVLTLLILVIGSAQAYAVTNFTPFVPLQQWFFSHPESVAMDNGGNIYVADCYNHRIQKFDSSGAQIANWGSRGNGDGQFDFPTSVAVDSSGNVYVADKNNSRIQKFDSTGIFLAKWDSTGDEQFAYPHGVAVDSGGNVYIADSNNYRILKLDPSGALIANWGSRGNGDDQFGYPTSVAVDSGGNVYVADSGNHRIQKFDSSGTFVAKWGSSGSGDSQFNTPNGVTVDSDGNIYVADTNNHRIQKFDSSGTFVAKWGSSGSGDGQFNYPNGVTVGSDGNIYVADSGNDRIQKLDSSGVFLMKWDSHGSGHGQFNYPWGLAVDSGGNVYVADSWNYRIQKFDPSGAFVAKWDSGNGDGQFLYGVAADSNGNIYVADSWNHRILKLDPSGALIANWGNIGSGDGQFNRPYGVAADSGGNVYVADFGNNRIQKFDSSGTFVAKWGSSGSSDGQFRFPYGVAVDSDGNIYVADSWNHRIQKFDSSGTFVTKWGSSGSGDGQFNAPNGIAADSGGNVYVADTNNNRIQKFDPTGAFVAKWGSSGYGHGQLDGPHGVAVDSGGNVYVADSSNHRIQLLPAPTLKVTSTVKGQPVASLGKPGVTIGTVTAGATVITAGQAADSTEAAPYVTWFDKNDLDAAVKVVKYTSGSDTNNFGTDPAYAGEAIANGDFFIIKLTASDMTTVSYYKIVVAVSAPEEAPVIHSATAGAARVNINWSPVVGATGYNIYMSTSSGSYGAALATVGRSVCSYDPTGLSVGITYYFVVTATNSGGESGYSNEVSAILPRTNSSASGHNNSTTSPPPLTITGSAMIAPAPGGIVSLGSEVSLSIPPTALQGSDNVKVTIQKVDTPPTVPAGFMVIGTVYQCTVNDQDHYNFNKQVTLTFTFDPSKLAPGETPAVYYYDDAKGQWVNIGGTVSGNTITISVDHFTLYAVMVEKLIPPPTQNPVLNLTDIAGHWAETNINELYGMGVISGYPDGTFKPDNTITRAEFATVLVKAFKLEQKSGHLFADTSSHWARDFISTAAGCGMISGYGNNRFGPDDYLTREQMTVMVVKAANLNKRAEAPIFTDSKDISAWAKDSVAAGAQAGIIKGYPDNSIRPQGNATKAEAITVIVNTLEL